MPWHSNKALNHIYRRICNLGNVQCDISCLCLKVPREFLRAKPPQWVEKTTKYRRFYTFWTARNWKRFQSGIGYKCSSYSSVKPKSRQIALRRGDIALLIVQNAENPSVSNGKTSVNWGVYAPKKHFYGCDRSSWVYAWLHREGTNDTVVTFT